MELKDPDVVRYSIFYHDIIYSVKKGDNELKSAELAMERLEQLGISPEKRQACYEQIVATKAHEYSENSDTNFLLDFDLAILGEPWDRYETYTKAIRKEYSIYPNFLYRKGRKKVLEHFIEMKHIFKTEVFKRQFEQQAKLNLQQELQAL